jgi:hypothetical protein
MKELHTDIEELIGMPSFENDDIVRKMKKLFLNLRV